MNLIKESVVETIQEIDLAKSKGTNRIELCSRLDVGGLTPSDDLIAYCLKTNIPTIIMIKVTDDQYMPDKQTFKEMKRQIKKYRNTSIEGFVFGILTSDNKIDINRITKLKKLSKDKQTIFHMAFDKIENKFEAIDILANIGITRILTKGGNNTAMENLDNLKKIVEYSKNKIEIIVGGKVTDDNYVKIADITKANQFHGRQLGIK
jgi:copper homeostasis protein